VFGDEYEGKDEEGPEAKLNRDKAAQEKADKDAVYDLIASLKPEMAYWKLLPWKVIQKYNVKRKNQKPLK